LVFHIYLPTLMMHGKTQIKFVRYFFLSDEIKIFGINQLQLALFISVYMPT
jgi:hypothetical protein